MSRSGWPNLAPRDLHNWPMADAGRMGSATSRLALAALLRVAGTQPSLWPPFPETTRRVGARPGRRPVPSTGGLRWTTGPWPPRQPPLHAAAGDHSSDVSSTATRQGGGAVTRGDAAHSEPSATSTP